MNKYKVAWEECANRHGGMESCWVKVDARGLVEARNGHHAIRRVKEVLPQGHLRHFKCRNFKAEKK